VSLAVVLLVVFFGQITIAATGSNFPVGSEWGIGKNRFIQFSSDGKVSGHGGCNRFFGTYRINNKQLRFGPLASTRMACSPGIMKREAKLLWLLGRVRGFRPAI